MRGRPLLEWLVFAAVWALLLVPLRRVTGGGREAAAPSGGVVAEDRRVPAWVRLTFSEPPAAFTVYAGGSVVWAERDPGEGMEQLVDLVPADGLELEVQWTEARRRAVELVVEPVEGTAWRRVLWTESRSWRERLVPE